MYRLPIFYLSEIGLSCESIQNGMVQNEGLAHLKILEKFGPVRKATSSVCGV